MVCLVEKVRIDPAGKAWLQVPHGLSSLGVGVLRWAVSESAALCSWFLELGLNRGREGKGGGKEIHAY